MKSKNYEFISLLELNRLETNLYIEKIFGFLFMLNYEYPRFNKWYRNLFLNGQLKDGREIIVCKNKLEIVGVIILKNDGIEKKICTLRVDERYQHQGIGRELMERSFQYLDTDKPLISVSKSKEKSFEKLFKYYGFNLEQEKFCYYKFLHTELVYNGELPRKDILFNKIELIDLDDIIDYMLYKEEYSIAKIINEYIVYCFQKRALAISK